MADMVRMKLDGDKALLDALQGLEGPGVRYAATVGVTAGGRHIVAAARANALSMIGGEMGAQIAKALTWLRLKAGKYKAFVTGGLGFAKGKYEALRYVAKFRSKRKDRTSFIPFAIEYGHGHDKAGAAIPFMRTATLSSGPAAMATVETMTWTGIEKYAAKKAKAKAK